MNHAERLVSRKRINCHGRISSRRRRLEVQKASPMVLDQEAEREASMYQGAEITKAPALSFWGRIRTWLSWNWGRLTGRI